MATAVDELLDMLFDMIDEAKNAAFSGDKCVIERDKALDLIEDAKKTASCGSGRGEEDPQCPERISGCCQAGGGGDPEAG